MGKLRLDNIPSNMCGFGVAVRGVVRISMQSAQLDTLLPHAAAGNAGRPVILWRASELQQSNVSFTKPQKMPAVILDFTGPRT